MDFYISNIKIKNGLVLAPMAGITDKTFRNICIKYGAGLTVSEMISAKGVYYNDKKTEALASSDENEKPYSLQIFGSDPEIMAIAAQRLLTINPNISIIDINMGCPMPKIVSNGDGSSLMKNPKLAGLIVNKVKKSVNVPVTVKMRTGWDKNSINAVELAKICEFNGADMICVHGRTKEQLYSPPVDYETIANVKKAIKIPVVANGGIYNSNDAINALKLTECDGLAIGQGAMGNPMIFEEISMALNGKTYKYLSNEEKIEIAKNHLILLCKDKGEYVGIREARKHLGWYIKGMKGSSETRNIINMTENLEELIILLNNMKEQNI